MDSGVKFDAESDVAHQLLEKGAQRAHFGPVKSQFKPKNAVDLYNDIHYSAFY